MAGTTTYYGISYPTSTDYVKDGATAMQTIATGFDSAVAIPTYNNQTGTTYTFVLADAAKVVSSNNASGVTFTIPPQSSVTWAAGTTLTVTNLGAGTLTIAGGAGVTVTNSTSTVSQYGSASIIRTASDAWTVIPFSGGALPLRDSAITSTTGSPTTATYTSGGINYKTYRWTGSGSIVTNKEGLIDVLIIAGGGAGGQSSGGGGGGGAVLQRNLVNLPAGTWTITVGAGGGASSYVGYPGYGSAITQSSSTTIAYLALGGGGGGSALTGATVNGDFAGGSGGGGCGTPYNGSGGGTLLAGCGNSGAGNYGGGGGAGAAASGGTGGAGLANTFVDGSTSVTYGGGGGGSGNGGSGGGGNNGVAGTANTGGGGGGGAGKSGGSGLVVIRVRA